MRLICQIENTFWKKNTLKQVLDFSLSLHLFK